MPNPRSDLRSLRDGAAAMVFLGGILVAAGAHAAVVISSKPTKNMNCTGGVCSPTKVNAILNVDDLSGMLASADVKVTAGNGANDIEVDDALTWTSTSRLTLDAVQSVRVKQAVMAEGTGALTITTNDGGSGGELSFLGKGHVGFWDTASSLIINANTYTLVNDIATLASDIAANPSGFYALAKFYDASVDGTYAAPPVPVVFTGTFEGLGHKISNLSINTRNVQYVGFFGQIGAGGVVRDFELENAAVIGSGSHFFINAGTIAGRSDGAILASFATGTAESRRSSSATGGIVGYDTGVISRSNAGVNVQAHSGEAGGLVGAQEGGSIDHSAATGSATVSDGSDVGGLAGHNTGLVSYSHASGRVKGGTNVRAGGLIGNSTGSVERSYATGAVLLGDSASGAPCGAWAGGLIGIHIASKTVSTFIDNSYSTGSVTAGSFTCVGGLIGEFDGHKKTALVTSSYAIGALSGDFEEGGLIGHGVDVRASPFTADYWDTQTTGASQPLGNEAEQTGIDGLTTAQFQSDLPAGFDPAIWGQNADINSGYPYLLTNPPQ